jgi:hypothetical protein
MNFTSKPLQIILEPKFAYVLIKAEVIILNVCEPHALNVLHCDLEKATFISVLSDTSTHKETKFFLVLVRYFD